jgi:flagellar hook-associated protein 3 FlgL
MISVSEDVANSPFGFKLAAATTTIAGVAVTGPAGSPPGITVDLAGHQPNAGDTLTFTLNLPDGTSEALTLRATTTSPPGDNEFLIGADPAATTANLQARLTSAVGQLAQTSLSAASAIAAANDFFNVDGANPPRRVDGPPFDTATGLIAGTSANTVAWYTGEAGTLSARATAVTRIDTAMNVSYGMRANEEALRTPVANLAVFAAMTFFASDPNGQQRYTALTQRLQANLSEPTGTQKIADIEAELAGSQAAMAAAEDRHTQTKAALTDLLQAVESAPLEEVGAQVLAVQTSLQASLQTAALLAKLSLVNYL